ncbi:expressed unknown protein [Seminavis robusta]|uniref:Uncharacterized protein n=1 Tax=Seminavis robusta TaxID=568900 RepID=A0A9N8HJN6_9STRA|nr:expressed unknown protein [Seminavis robusta]|eukprot:Sro562_g167090.1 n/a (291) ;mRNA; f:39783-40655
MVVKGRFSVEVVNAVTKIPFKEHVSRCGEHYAEVEPEAEYFLRVDVGGQPRRRDNEEVYIDFEVDGVDLDYCIFMTPKDEPYLCGSYEQSNGRAIDCALQFVTPQRSKTTSASSSPAVGKEGTISVSFHTAVFDGMEIREDFKSTEVASAWSGAGARKVKSNCKVVRSGQGAFAHEYEVSTGLCKRFRPGKHLETIYLKYCTALGLIHAGILPQPPIWELARMKERAKQRALDMTADAFVSVSRGLECKLYDLTQDEDDHGDDCLENSSWRIPRKPRFRRTHHSLNRTGR